MRIAFIGAAGSGKDVAARYLAQHFAFQRVAFADQLKVESFAALHNANPHAIARRHAIDWVDARKGEAAMRAYLQAFGQAKRDFVDADYWLDWVLTAIAGYEATHGPANWVVTDCRYPNEAAALIDAGFVLVRVHRHNYSPLPGATTAHASETALADYETLYTLHNPGDDTFAAHIDELVATILEDAGLQ